MRLFLAFLLLLAATSDALSAFIAVPLIAAVGITGTAAAIASTLVTAALTIGASYGLSLISTALRSSTKDPSQGPSSSTSVLQSAAGNDLTTQYGGDVPRTAIFGLSATAGHLVYANVYGPDNNTLQAVFVLGDGQHDSISRLWYNGKLVTVAPGGQGEAREIPDFTRSSDGGICVHIKFFDGRFDQEADPELYNGANPAGRWTANHRGRGVCYLVVTQIFSEELELTGIPTLLVELQGMRLYDPRFDSTVGGSGGQRWGQPDTYGWTDNPAIIEYNYRRGIFVGDQMILGMGVSSADLILPMYMSAANVCDESVATLEGPFEKRYRCGFTASADQQHSQAITTVRDAMAGYSLERAGQFAPIPGVNQLTLFTFTDDDLEVGKAFSYSKYRTRSAIATAVYGSFSDPEQLWGAVPFPARLDLADDALMGERLSRNVDLTQVFSHSQAQRLAEIDRRRSMLQPNGSCTLPAKFFGIQPGDWGTYQSERYGTFDVVVKGTTINQDHSITLTWDRIDQHVFAWTTAGEENRPAIPTGGEAGQRVNIVTGFAAIGIDISGDGGIMHPGFQVLWDVITDPTIDAIILEYRVAALAGDWEEILFTAPAQGFGQFSGGIQGATVYELRAALLVSPYRPTGIAGPISALSGNHIVQSALNFPPDLPAFIAGKVAAQFTDTINEQRHIVDFLAAHTADVDAQQIIERARVKRDVGTVILDLSENFETSDRTSNARAFIGATADASAEEAIAGFAVDLTTSYVTTNGTAQSSAQILAVAQSNANTAIATYDQSVSATIGGTITSNVIQHETAVATLEGQAAASYVVTLDVNHYATGFQLLNGGAPGTGLFGIYADRFWIAQPGAGGGSPVPVFAIQAVNGAAQIAFRGEMFADGTIFTRNLTANVINTATLIADNVIIRNKIVPETSTKLTTAGFNAAMNWDGNLYLQGSLIVDCAGGPLYVAVTTSTRSGLINNALATTNHAELYDVVLYLYYDGSLLQTVNCNARCWQILYNASNAQNRLGIDIAGSWPLDITFTPSAGNHQFDVYLAAFANVGVGPVNYNTTIAAVEGRR